MAATGDLLVPNPRSPRNHSVHPHPVPTSTQRPSALGLEHLCRAGDLLALRRRLCHRDRNRQRPTWRGVHLRWSAGPGIGARHPGGRPLPRQAGRRSGPLEQIAHDPELLWQVADQWGVGARHYRSRFACDRRSALGSRLGIYSPGANFANQLSSVASNALAPAGVHLGNVYGRDGEEGTFREFKRLQRIWVVAVTGWTLVAMAAAYFGIIAWLGPRFHLAGWICVVLTAGSAVPLVTGLIGTYIGAIGRAGALARYGAVSTVVNIALTVPLVLLGSLGVVTATAVGQLVAAVYMLHDVRRSVRRDIPNPLHYIPLLRGTAAAVLTLGLGSLYSPTCRWAPWGCSRPAYPPLPGSERSVCLCWGPAGCSGSWPSLEQAYRNCATGPAPLGRSRGRKARMTNDRPGAPAGAFLPCPRSRRSDPGTCGGMRRVGEGGDAR